MVQFRKLSNKLPILMRGGVMRKKYTPLQSNAEKIMLLQILLHYFKS